MNLNKSLEFFDPVKVKDPIHIIGVGAIGSNLVDIFTRFGIEDIHIYDFDAVDPHNIANQRYTHMHLNQPKVHVMHNYMKDINPVCKPVIHEKGWKSGMMLTGHVFLAVDNIDLRREIVKENQYNPNIKSIHDFRMRLQDAQYYMADNTPAAIDNLLRSMDFTHEEAVANTPVSACGTALNVSPTVLSICSFGASNFINYVKEGSYKKCILVDAFNFNLLAM